MTDRTTLEPDYVRCAAGDSPLGRIAVAVTGRGIAAVRIGGDAHHGNPFDAMLRERWPHARLRPDDGTADRVRAEVTEYVEGRRRRIDRTVDADGTPFQRSVWRELRRIPYGETRTYGEIARALGRPATAARAVAGACAANRVALIVPCHRVVRSDGGPGGYRWGVGRKRTLLAMEAESAAPTPARRPLRTPSPRPRTR